MESKPKVNDNKVAVLYNKNYYDFIYQTMLEAGTEIFEDDAGTVWHIDDVEVILMDVYGYEFTMEGLQA